MFIKNARRGKQVSDLRLYSAVNDIIDTYVFLYFSIFILMNTLAINKSTLVQH